MDIVTTDRKYTGTVKFSGLVEMAQTSVAGLTDDSTIEAEGGQLMVKSKEHAATIPFHRLVKQDAWKDALADGPEGDGSNLGLGDAAGSLITGTSTNNTSAKEALGFVYSLPSTYIASGTVEVIVRCKVDVNRNTHQKLDVIAKEIGDTLGADICGEAEQAITTAYDDYTFAITDTGLVAGDRLWIEVYLDMDDTGGSSGGVPTISKISVNCQQRT